MGASAAGLFRSRLGNIEKEIIVQEINWGGILVFVRYENVRFAAVLV